MNFSSDRDLLVMEPNVFADVAIAAQARLSVNDAAVSGTTLTSAAADFEAAQIGAGSVVLVADVAHEVVARTDAHTLTVSLPRARLSDPPIPGPGGSGKALTARTFAPQAALVHDVLLRLVGIEPGDPDATLSEDSVVSLSTMAYLEVLGTLERIYASAGELIAPGGWRNTLLLKSDDYRRRFQDALGRAAILIDTDGDGHGDRTIRPSVVTLTRI